MSSQFQPGPIPGGGGVPLPPSPERLQQAFDHGTWYALALWPALHIACTNSWGGPESFEKRDWFAGAVSDLFTTRPETDEQDLETFLLQVMADEFECVVEDGSEGEVARGILGLRKGLRGEEAGGDRLARFRELEGRWRNRGLMKGEVLVIDHEAEEEEEEEEEEWNGFDEDGDVDMTAGEEAVPRLVPAVMKKERVEPEVDDDGFTKVVGKKKR
ncbi:hypothetical protein B0A55_06314 [Friedmanniomyces simplex]|uniref:Pre-rRNA-processing protein TSR2 n=1 Tax=Friedmanniomyces simplex TaxID=329884 RepID=A0A4U0XCT0_9PEZI|nr:hypothetical protein B0A55_06314 [Friedmanniomyces simplex]